MRWGCKRRSRTGRGLLVLAILGCAPGVSATLVIDEGEHVVTDSLWLIETDLEIRPGATLLMGPNASIVAFEGVQAIGTAEKPIVFTWLEEGSRWGAFVIFRAASNGSRFAHCVFEHGTGASVDSVSYSGMLSVYNAEADIEDCVIQDKAEQGDGINVRSGWARIERCEFNRCSDAVDSDESGGTIVDCIFRDTRNDAIDLGAASDVTCSGNEIYDAVDKGISVGESSVGTIENNIIVGCAIGIAIKDSSDPLVINNTLFGNGIGIAAYDKSGVPDGGKGTVVNTIIWGSDSTSVSVDSLSTTEFHHSCIEGGWEGEGNIDADPLWVDRGSADFHLGETSPCIDAGTQEGAPVVDFEGDPRPRGMHWDIGADEAWFLGAVDSTPAMPRTLPTLAPARPNPFNPHTTIGFEVESGAAVRLTIHDLRGATVRTLVDGVRQAGSHAVTWDGRNDAGSAVTSGVYVVRLRAGKETRMGRVVLVE